MPNFKEFLDFLVNIGILNTKHLNLLQAKNPTPIEESDILWTLTDFFKTLESNDFFQITSSLYQKFFAGYSNISGYTKDLAFIKSIIGDRKINSSKKTTKNIEKMKESENKINGKIEKLYSDSFHKEEFLKIKQEIHMKQLLKECTFVPEINQSKIIAKKLNVPVFERLSKHNTKSSKDISETQKNIVEIQECTFRPQVLKYITSNNSEKETKAFQRLYQNAESLRQNQRLKKQNNEEIEAQELSFVPEINEASSKIMNKKRAATKETTPFERLYQVSQEKKPKNKNEDQFWRNEENECTFKPETCFTEDYQEKSKILQEMKNSNIYERLYQNNSKANIVLDLIENKARSDKKNKGKEQTPIFNKLYNQRHLKTKKQEEIRKEYFKEIGATFKPKINEPKLTRKLSVPILSKSFTKEKNKQSKEIQVINKSFSTQSFHLNSSNKKIY